MLAIIIAFFQSRKEICNFFFFNGILLLWINLRACVYIKKYDSWNASGVFLVNFEVNKKGDSKSSPWINHCEKRLRYFRFIPSKQQRKKWCLFLLYWQLRVQNLWVSIIHSFLGAVIWLRKIQVDKMNEGYFKDFVKSQGC